MFRGAYRPIGIANARGAAPFGRSTATSASGTCSRATDFSARCSSIRPLQWRWPAKAEPGVSLNDCPAGSGQEDFGGSMTQAADGKIYLQCGSRSVRNVEVEHLDKVVAGWPAESFVVPLRMCNEPPSFATRRSRRPRDEVYSIIKRLTPGFAGGLRCGLFAERATWSLSERRQRRVPPRLPPMTRCCTWVGMYATTFAVGERHQGRVQRIRLRRHGRFSARDQSPGVSPASRCRGR